MNLWDMAVKADGSCFVLALLSVACFISFERLGLFARPVEDPLFMERIGIIFVPER